MGKDYEVVSEKSAGWASCPFTALATQQIPLTEFLGRYTLIDCAGLDRAHIETHSVCTKNFSMQKWHCIARPHPRRFQT